MREPLANIGTRVWVQTKGSARISPPERKRSEGRRQSGCSSLAEAQLAHRKRQRKAEALQRIFPPPQGSSPSAHDRSPVCFLGNKLKGTGEQFLQGCSLPEGSSSGGAGLLQRQTQGAHDQGEDAPAAGGEVRAEGTQHDVGQGFLLCFGTPSTDTAPSRPNSLPICSRLLPLPPTMSHAKGFWSM